MNATVAKSAKSTKKIAGTTSRAKPAAKPAAKKTARTAAKSAVKTFAKKAVKALTESLKPAKKSAAKPAAKKSPAKSTVKSTKTVAKTKVPSAARSGAAKTAKKAATPATKAKPAVKPAAKKTATTAQPSTKVAATRTTKASPPAPVATKKATSGPIGRIEQPVVSKASEVATKTSKSTPTAENSGALLSEEEILKMSEKDYMNPAQLAFFKHRLQELEKELLKNADETTEHLRETVLVPDPADRATIEEEHALELRTRDRERKLLKKVQQSIASIDSGDYGWCEETGEPIGIPRLLARPTATLSLEAQQRRELKQKLYGD
jgi:DnaK suppressor protein